MTEHCDPPSFWRTVTLLLRFARKRSIARRERASQILQQKSGRDATDWGSLGKMFSVLIMLAINGMAAFTLGTAVESAQRSTAEQQGKIAVSRSFLEAVRKNENYKHSVSSQRTCYQLHGQTYCYDAIVRQPVPPEIDYQSEASRIADNYGGSSSAVEQKLREAVRREGAGGFVLKNDVSLGLTAIASSGRFTEAIGSLVLLWWGIMLVCQGEGLDLDISATTAPDVGVVILAPGQTRCGISRGDVDSDSGQPNVLGRTAFCRYRLRRRIRHQRWRNRGAGDRRTGYGGRCMPGQGA